MIWEKRNDRNYKNTEKVRLKTLSHIYNPAEKGSITDPRGSPDWIMYE